LPVADSERIIAGKDAGAPGKMRIAWVNDRLRRHLQEGIEFEPIFRMAVRSSIVAILSAPPRAGIWTFVMDVAWPLISI
jgi:hypothetical protein